MATFAVSFSIAFDSAASWNRRYESLMAAINKSARVWDETTSFCLVDSAESLEAFEQRLSLTEFDPSKDLLFVMDASYDSCTIRGVAKKKQALKQLMPLVQEK